MIRVNFSPNIVAESATELLEKIWNNPMAGWMRLPLDIDSEEILQIKECASKICAESEVLVCIGIGGSYLGHRAVIEALRPKGGIKIVYAGNSLSQREMEHTLEEISDKDFSVVVISKSGTTLEPARAFETFKQKLIEKYGMIEASQRIYAITDSEKGELHAEAVRDGYRMFAIPNDIGGRYSVLTPVGLLPMAVAGIDIDGLLSGAETGARVVRNFMKDSASEMPAAVKYGFMRYMLGSRGYDTEVFASFEPATMYFNEWIKQLFGESEGKEKQGVLPAAVIYSTDLHSLGQFMQDGRRNLWETIINFPTDEINAKVLTAVQRAHTNGGLPVLKIDVESFDAKGFGELIFFFEMACAISASLFNVNPFDQPGVEAYKNELKVLLEK